MAEARTELDDGVSTARIRLQWVILGLIRATEAIAWTSIFPYVYFMVQSFPGVKDDEIAFYAALLIAIFTFCEFLSGMVWAKVSDRIGRKPTLLIGLVTGMITATTLGFSRSIWMACASRAFGGLFNPFNGLVPTCVGETAKRKEQQAEAFSLVAFIRTLGSLVGPFLGGILADPVAHYPSLFPSNSVWSAYRYLLPNLCVVLLLALTFALGFLFLEETHPEYAGRPDIGLRIGSSLAGYRPLKQPTERAQGYGTVDPYTYTDEPDAETGMCGETNAQALADCNEFEGDQQGATETQNLLGSRNDGVTGPASHDGEALTKNSETRKSSRTFTAQTLLQIASVSLLAFHKVSSDAVMPTFLATPSNDSDASSPGAPGRQLNRGFGFNSAQIGYILFSQAIVASVSQAVVIPFLIGKLGPLKTYRVVLCIYPAAYLFTPLLPSLSKPWPLVAVCLDLWVKVVLSSMGYICSAILITNTTLGKENLASVNGAAASLGCLARAIGPTVTGLLFGVGQNAGNIGIAFWTLSGVAALAAVEAVFLRDYP